MEKHNSDRVKNLFVQQFFYMRLSSVSQEIAASSEDTSRVSDKSLQAVNKVNGELMKINEIACDIQNTVKS